ncbi:PaaI family thioesterase [Paraperlucidibaca sp.]|uniref:PaaI family thioesterase n=1 Tax=Paraperlucidibaca sp. TaxID=2708021 RepID=UPI0030F3E56D
MSDSRQQEQVGMVDHEPLSDSPYVNFLGVDIEELKKGQPVYRMTFREQHVGNPLIKTFHGGILASFAEIVASLHVQSELQLNEEPDCTSMTFDYLRPAFAGTLRAEPMTVRAGKRFIVIAVDVYLEQKLVSRGRFIYTVRR